MGFLATGREVAGLEGKYTVVRALPRGGFGAAFQGVDPSGGKVLVKEVHVGDADAWSRFDALVREARTTRHLRHPRIPKHIELFAYDGEKATAFETVREEVAGMAPLEGARSLVLVRSFVEGETLAAAIRERRRFGNAELECLLRGLLGARHYLDGLMPRVVHGDASPSNIVVDGAMQAWLIDFGGAFEATSRNPSAAVGTMGFMPPEQLSGAPTVASDLFAIAMSILVAATHREPDELPRNAKTGKIDVRQAAPTLSERLARTLEACLEPDVSARARDAEEAKELLSGRWSSLGESRSKARRWVRDHRRRVLGGAALIAACSLAFGWQRHRAHASEPAPEPRPLVLPFPVLLGPVPGSTEGMHEETPPLVPKAEPAPPPPPPRIEWPGVVESTGGSSPVAKGQSCLVSLDVDGSVFSSEDAVCQISVTCGETSLASLALASDCSVRELQIEPGTFTYEASFATTVDPPVGLEIAGSSHDRRVLVQTQTPEGTSNLVTIKLDPRSQARSGVAVTNSARFATPRAVHGVLVESTGHDVPRKGEACNLVLEASDMADVRGSENCSARLSCGSKVLYDGTGSCPLDSSLVPTFFEDGKGSLIDETPRFDVAGHVLTVSDATTHGFEHTTVYLDAELNRPSEE